MMTEDDVIKELLDEEPFLRLYPTFKSYLREIEGVSVDLALELYASHVLPGDVVKLVNVYISRA